MTEPREREEAEFAERLRRAYRETPPPGPEAAARIVAAVERRRRAHTGGFSWWRPRTVTVRPVIAAAAALLLVALGAAVTWRLGPRHVPGPVAHVATADPHTIRFVFADPGASHVSLVGDFNGWDRNATPLHPGPVAGYWSVSLHLPAGWHSYAFVVDGTRWINDPLAPLTPADDLGPPRSVVVVKGGA